MTTAMKWTLAIGFIGYGILVFLGALGLLHHGDNYYWNRYWPVLLFAFGAEWLYRSRRRRAAEWLIPLLSALFGLFLLLHNLGLIGLTFIHPVNVLYAVLLIYVGLMILGAGHFRIQVGNGNYNVRWHKPKQKDDSGSVRQERSDSFSELASDDFDMDVGDGSYTEPATPPPPPPPVKPWIRMPSVGEVRYGDSPWHLEPLLIDNLAGSIRINLATATVSPGETPIIINGGAGEVRIQVPEDLGVSVAVEVFGGEVRLLEQRISGLSLHPMSYEDPWYDEASCKVRIQVKLRFGEVRITRMI